MRWDDRDRRRRHLAVATGILLAGLAAAVVIYVRATATADAPLEFSPDTSKRYLRDLELYGGTANVLAVEAKTWWDGLWHGTSLAYTVAALALLAALAYAFLTVVLPPYRDPDADANGDRRPRA